MPISNYFFQYLWKSSVVILIIIDTSANFLLSRLFHHEFKNISPVEGSLSNGRSVAESNKAWSVAAIVNTVAIAMTNWSGKLLRKKEELVYEQNRIKTLCICIMYITLDQHNISKWLNFSCKCRKLNLDLSASNTA